MTSSERAVDAEAYADCPFSTAQEYATDYLRRAQAGTEEAEIRVPVGLFPAVIQHRATITFGLHFDVLEAGRTHEEIRVSWDAGTPLLPNFRGTMRFRISGIGTLVSLEGTYRVPFGILGAAFDALAGKRIAQSSVNDFTYRIARALESDQRDWRARVTMKESSVSHA